MNISIYNNCNWPIDERSFAKIISRILDDAIDTRGVFLEVISIAEEGMTREYEKHLGKKQPTDVLSFAIDSPNQETRPLVLGSILLCPELIIRQGDFRIEECLIHGLLHLIGFEDEKEKDWQEMEKVQEKWVATLLEKK